MHSVSFVFDGKVFTIMSSGYFLAWHVPRVLRDARQRTINAKRPPSKTPQAPRQQPPARRCGSSEGRNVASRRKLSQVRSGHRRRCIIVQHARLTRLRIAYCPCSRALAGETLLSHPDILGPWLNRKCDTHDCQQRGCESFEGDSTELDSLPPIAAQPWHTPR